MGRGSTYDNLLLTSDSVIKSLGGSSVVSSVGFFSELVGISSFIFENSPKQDFFKLIKYKIWLLRYGYYGDYQDSHRAALAAAEATRGSTTDARNATVDITGLPC